MALIDNNIVELSNDIKGFLATLKMSEEDIAPLVYNIEMRHYRLLSTPFIGSKYTKEIVALIDKYIDWCNKNTCNKTQEFVKEILQRTKDFIINKEQPTKKTPKPLLLGVNNRGFKLLTYLIDKYAIEEGTKASYVFIWKFMKQQHKIKDNGIIFTLKQDKYTSFVNKGKLKFQIIGFKYEDKVKPTLYELTTEFNKCLK